MVTASIFNYGSSQSETNTGPIIGAGQLVVNGSGTLTLLGTNTYTGNTTIGGAGSLVLSPAGGGGSILAGNINATSTGILLLAGAGATTIGGNLNATTVVTNGGTLALLSTNAGTAGVTLYNNSKLNMAIVGASQWSPASLTLGAVTLNFNGVTNSGTTTAPINPTAAVTRNGAVTVNVNSTADPNIVVGSSYPLLKGVSSTTGYTLGSQPVGWAGQLQINGNTLVYVTTKQADIWNNASGNNLWDIGTSTNWVGNALLNSPQFTFKNGDDVLFNDSVTSNQVITLSGLVQPVNVIGFNGTRAYTIHSTAGNDFSGTGGLTMLGTNTLTLSGGANTYSGATTINAGTVSVGVLANNNLPSDLGQPNSTDPGKLVLNGGTLAYRGVTAGTDRGVTVGANNGTISVTNPATTLTLNGIITGPGMLTKGGSGTMFLTMPPTTIPAAPPSAPAAPW